METYRRSLLNAPKSGSGEIVETLKKNSLKPQANDGEHKYTNTRITPKQPPPYRENDQFELSLCSSNFDVTEFENSYIHLRLRFRFTFSATDLPFITEEDENHVDPAYKQLLQHQYVFIGFKASSHCIGSYSFKFHDKPISSTQQSQAVTEQFLYSNFKAKGEISNKKYVYSPYKEVSEFDNSICGRYISLWKILTNRNGDAFSMEVIIPYTELLIMQDFDEYPNFAFGDLKIVLQIIHDGLVFAPVNPIASLRKAILRGDIPRDANGNLPDGMTSILALDSETMPYTHAFTQVGMKGKLSVITGVDGDHKVTSWNPTDFRIVVDETQVTEAYVDCRGYKMTNTARQELMQHWQTHPFTVLAQKVTRSAFPTSPQPGELNTNFNVALNRVTDLYLLMPTDSLQRTCFCNPALKNFQLQVGNITYPNQAISTISPEYHEQQIQQTDFDSIFEATEEYEHSLTDCRVGRSGFKEPTTDDTGFVPIFMVERANAGTLIFDGLDSPNEKIELKGQAINNNYNVYYKNNTVAPGPSGIAGTVENIPPPPILCMCSDTYWIFRLNGNEANVQYVTNSSYDAAYADPSLENTSAYSSEIMA